MTTNNDTESEETSPVPNGDVPPPKIMGDFLASMMGTPAETPSTESIEQPAGTIPPVSKPLIKSKPPRKPKPPRTPVKFPTTKPVLRKMPVVPVQPVEEASEEPVIPSQISSDEIPASLTTEEQILSIAEEALTEAPPAEFVLPESFSEQIPAETSPIDVSQLGVHQPVEEVPVVSETLAVAPMVEQPVAQNFPAVEKTAVTAPEPVEAPAEVLRSSIQEDVSAESASTLETMEPEALPIAPAVPVSKAKVKNTGRKLPLIPIAVGAVALIVIAAAVMMIKPGQKKEAVPVTTRPETAKPMSGEKTVQPLKLNPRITLPLPSEEDVNDASVELTGQLDSTFASKVLESSSGLKLMINKACLSVIDPKYQLSDKDFEGLNESQKSLLTAYQQVFTQIRESLATNESRFQSPAQVNAEYARLVQSVESIKPMEIGKLVLCRRVSGYGRYEAFPDNQFTAGMVPIILAYVELAYIKPVRYPDGRFVSKMTVDFVLTDSSGQEVWREGSVSTSDVSYSRRRDFFLAQYVRLPETLAPGEYDLKVSVTDDDTTARAEAQTSLIVVGQ